MNSTTKLNADKAVLTFTSNINIDVPQDEEIDEVIMEISANIKYRLDGKTNWIKCNEDAFIESQRLKYVLLDANNQILLSEHLDGSLVTPITTKTKSVGTQSTLDTYTCKVCDYFNNEPSTSMNIQQQPKVHLVMNKQPTVQFQDGCMDTEQDVIFVKKEQQIYDDKIHIKQEPKEPSLSWKHRLNNLQQSFTKSMDIKANTPWKDRLDGLHKSFKNRCTCQKCKPTHLNSKSWTNRIQQIKKHNKYIDAEKRIQKKQLLRRSSRIAAKRN